MFFLQKNTLVWRGFGSFRGWDFLGVSENVGLYVFLFAKKLVFSWLVGLLDGGV